MIKYISFIGIICYLESCSVYKKNEFYYPKKKKVYSKVDSKFPTLKQKNPEKYIVSSTFSKSTLPSPDYSKMSEFEQAVINSWDDFTEEEKKFFRNAVISIEKIDSLYKFR
jgi:hypothetical protein